MLWWSCCTSWGQTGTGRSSSRTVVTCAVAVTAIASQATVAQQSTISRLSGTRLVMAACSLSVQQARLLLPALSALGVRLIDTVLLAAFLWSAPLQDNCRGRADGRGLYFAAVCNQCGTARMCKCTCKVLFV
jgi:hypothetical protein